MPSSSSLPFKLAVAAAMASLALSGCSTASQSNASTPSGTTGFEASTVSQDEALAALVPADLKAKGTLTVGSDTSYAPAEFLGGDDGQTPQGYDVDLAKAIGATLGLTTEVATSEFTGILPALGTKYDLGISSFTINPERSKTVNFVSYFNAGTQWAVLKGNPGGLTLEDLCGKRVGVQTGTVQDPDVAERSKVCVADGKEAIEVISLKSQTDVTTRLVNGGIDAMAADSPVTGYALSQTGDSLENLGEVYDGAKQGIAVAKSDKELAELVGKVVNKLISDGTYAKILESWSNSDGAIVKAQVNPESGS
ncbi:ABC transporter substrate-binding protein [Paeniglutamicibacter psychrophenolicus]|uniref:Polar amino acid transport system substrate-binding protein n=2 Tax=Paeniglutamicibacter psychrophenolicus TaxID=257454 RepID=A0ABS4WA11_9MICC|nr:ABC transporter substrate-binding protein [Paeniglutamicibacter psychrophenolicus]MBP2373034.1 polar amino acid transport system substrate-binding protein [Paeniglutamicibacter psychrophenolicus]